MSDECMTAFDVLTLVVTFLRLLRNLKAATRVCGVSAQRAIHHFANLHLKYLRYDNQNA